MKPGQDPDILNAREAAALLGVSTVTITAWMKAGKIPHRRVTERCVYFSKAALRDWWAGREAPEKD